MYVCSQDLRQTQDVAEDVETLSIGDILPDNFDHPAPDDLTVQHHLWSLRAERRFSENIVRNAILTAWREGALGSVEALFALIEYDALDFEHAMQSISDFALIGEKLVSLEASVSVEGKAA